MKPLEIVLTIIAGSALVVDLNFALTGTGTPLEFGGLALIAINAMCIYKLCSDRKKYEA